MRSPKWLLLGLLALIVPACSGDTVVAPPLLTDTFASFPGTNWTTPSVTNSGDASQDTGVGNPQPSLKFSTGAASGTATTTTTASFNNPSVTFSMQLAATASAGEKGTFLIELLDNTSAVVASALWNPETTALTFFITGGSVAALTVPPANGGFNTFRFNVSAAGAATWSLNGAAQATNPAFAAGALKLRFTATWGTGAAWPEFNVDNVTVTSP